MNAEVWRKGSFLRQTFKSCKNPVNVSQNVLLLSALTELRSGM